MSIRTFAWGHTQQYEKEMKKKELQAQLDAANLANAELKAQLQEAKDSLDWCERRIHYLEGRTTALVREVDASHEFIVPLVDRVLSIIKHGDSLRDDLQQIHDAYYTVGGRYPWDQRGRIGIDNEPE